MASQRPKIFSVCQRHPPQHAICAVCRTATRRRHLDAEAAQDVCSLDHGDELSGTSLLATTTWNLAALLTAPRRDLLELWMKRSLRTAS